MATPLELTWAKSYYYTGNGLPIPDPLDDWVEDSVARDYKNKFMEPLNRLKGTPTETLPSPEDIKTLSQLASKYKIKGVMRYLPYMAHIADSSLSWPANLEDSFAKLAKMRKVICQCQNGEPFIAFKDDNGNIPEKPDFVHELGDLNRFPDGLPDVHALAREDWRTMNDFRIKAIQQAFAHGIINESELRVIPYAVPDGNKIVNVNTTAVDNRIPRYAIRKLINNLPTSTIDNAESVYHAAYNFCMKHPDMYQYELKDLRVIIKSVSTEEPVELNDETVIKYLNEVHGMNIDDLQQVLKPNVQDFYMSTVLLSDEDTDMSAKDFVNKLTTSDKATTLDSIVEKYCQASNIPLTCSIEQLLKHMTVEDADIDPLNQCRYTLCDYWEAGKIDADMTIDDFLELKTSKDGGDQITRLVNGDLDTIAYLKTKMVDANVYGDTLLKNLGIVIKQPEVNEEDAYMYACTRLADSDPEVLDYLKRNLIEGSSYYSFMQDMGVFDSLAKCEDIAIYDLKKSLEAQDSLDQFVSKLGIQTEPNVTCFDSLLPNLRGYLSQSVENNTPVTMDAVASIIAEDMGLGGPDSFIEKSCVKDAITALSGGEFIQAVLKMPRIADKINESNKQKEIDFSTCSLGNNTKEIIQRCVNSWMEGLTQENVVTNILKDAGFESKPIESIAPALLAGKGPEEVVNALKECKLVTSDTPVELVDDLGYNVCEYILQSVRKEMLHNDSLDFKMGIADISNHFAEFFMYTKGLNLEALKNNIKTTQPELNDYGQKLVDEVFEKYLGGK